jgi:hypothetical protein
MTSGFQLLVQISAVSLEVLAPFFRIDIQLKVACTCHKHLASRIARIFACRKEHGLEDRMSNTLDIPISRT